LNRNYGVDWKVSLAGGKSGKDPCSETYPG
jgi:hypothetical protein